MSTEHLQRINDHARRTLELLLYQFGSLPGTTVGRIADSLEVSSPEGTDVLAVDTGSGPDDLSVELSGKKSNWKRLIDAIVASVQEIEDEAWKLHTLRWIQTSQGAQLDGVGDLYGVPRGGLDDEEYRERIRVAAFRNSSSGTRDQLIQILAALTGTVTANIVARNVYPAAVEMETDGQSIPQNLGPYMQSFAGAGIDLWVQLFPPEPGYRGLRVVDISPEDEISPMTPSPGYGTFCDVDGDDDPVEYPDSARITDVIYSVGG